MAAENGFYLGNEVDPATGQVSANKLFYDPDDLTTHAVVVGMTGSGKTGLCIDLMEEAALRGLPALMIDPKGDIANALLHFPALAPRDFEPWINVDQARRDGKTIQQAAADAAQSWRDGLARSEIGPERIQALADSVRFTVFTPGSDSGVPVSILASLKVPPIPWETNREILREKISGTVTALLGLVGLTNIDPVRSREHILLSNIFEYAWSKDKDLDLGELIMQTQSPPFPKLGVFDVNTFFPEKDRFELAMLLNNILASPAFQAWIEGEPLDIPSLLYTEDGKPRHSIFYIAHLSEAERMFFITLLYSAVETWMRSQTGSPSLRALVYFDEIFGYLPPVANPPSKEPMLRMLKQARAFGVGMVLATQNPVDVDYKALANAGTWFIGKLQTDQDKQRLLDGLEGAMAGSLDRAGYDRMISTLGKRVFLLHNIHAKGPKLFTTRFAMNYLPGPIARVQIPQLNALVQLPQAPLSALQPVNVPSSSTFTGQAAYTTPFQPAPTAPQVKVQPVPEQEGTSTRPSVPMGVREYFLPNNITFTEAFQNAGRAYPQEAFSQGLIYRPVLLAQASIRFLNRKFNLDTELKRTVTATLPDRRGLVKWDNFLVEPVDPDRLDSSPAPQSRFAPLDGALSDTKEMTALQRDFIDWAFRTGQVTVYANEQLKVYGGPPTSEGDFRTMCSEAARDQRDAEINKVETLYDKKLEAIQLKLTKEERELDSDKSELSQRKIEEMGTAAENVFGLFSGRRSSRRLSSSLTKRRLTSQAKADVEESVDSIAEMKKQIAALDKEKQAALQQVNDRWGDAANQISTMKVDALKRDVLLELFGVGWFPYHVVKSGDQTFELPGYGRKR